MNLCLCLGTASQLEEGALGPVLVLPEDSECCTSISLLYCSHLSQCGLPSPHFLSILYKWVPLIIFISSIHFLVISEKCPGRLNQKSFQSFLSWTLFPLSSTRNKPEWKATFQSPEAGCGLLAPLQPCVCLLPTFCFSQGSLPLLGLQHREPTTAPELEEPTGCIPAGGPQDTPAGDSEDHPVGMALSAPFSGYRANSDAQKLCWSQPCFSYYVGFDVLLLWGENIRQGSWHLC